MANFSLRDSNEYYISLSEPMRRFDADSPATNVFFDDTNGEVFTVRSGGVTGVTVTGMSPSQTASFRMEDRGTIISIKFSPDYKVLAIQRNVDNQNSRVEFVNFKDMQPTNVEYSHTCKWKSCKILGFVWPKANEIAYITDHGIELLQVIPEKKQLKSFKNVTFSGAWFTWCAQSNVVLLAGNNGALLQPFSLKNSSIMKLQKLEWDFGRPVVERDVFVLRISQTTWCAVFKHGSSPTEVWLMGIMGAAFPGAQYTHVLKTGLVGRFAINVVDDLIAVHHQSTRTSMLFDIMEDSKPENNMVVHIPIVPAKSIKPPYIGDQGCPMYSDTWVVFRPDYVIDARLGCFWRVQLIPAGLAHSIQKDQISKVVAVLLRRTDGKDTILQILNQLVVEASAYLIELGKVFDEINVIYRKWAELEVARNTAGHCVDPNAVSEIRVVISQSDICRVLRCREDENHLTEVVTLYLASLSKHDIVIQHDVAELCVRTLVTRGAYGRLRALIRRGCLGDSKPLACQLLSLGHIDEAFAQLALDMMWRLHGYKEVVEVLLSWGEAVSACGTARQAGVAASISPRKLLSAVVAGDRQGEPDPAAFLALYHATRHAHQQASKTHTLKGVQCDSFDEYYKQVMADSQQTTRP